jgi:hypothetical protein
MLAILVSTVLAAATPICPHGEVVPPDDVCPLQLPAADLLADNMPFQSSFLNWSSCARASGEETARRAGRAGGRPVDYSDINDCATQAASLGAVVEALPPGGPREQALAAIERTREAIAAMAAEVYQRNNYE